jgi:hypothetical protein
MQNLHQSTQEHEIYYSDRYSEDEQLLIKITFCFMEEAHEPLYLDKWNSVSCKIMGIPTSFIWSIVSFDGAFEYGGDSKFWGCVAKNAVLLFVEFSNFV